MKREPPYCEYQSHNPFRPPDWRWDRANDLVNRRRYYSKKRDDTATGIAVRYLRDMARCYSELRLRRTKDRYKHVDQAKQLRERSDDRRLEIEARMLARQNDVEIGLQMDLPAATVQAFRDIFFHVDDRIDATSYILFQVVGLQPQLPPCPVTLMKSSAYSHGPAVIEPWLQYLRDGPNAGDLTSADGRLAATIDLVVAAQAVRDDVKTCRSLAKLAPILLTNGSNFPKSVSAAKAFSESTSRITADLDLPGSVLAPFSYAPDQQGWRTDGYRTRRWKDRKVA